MIPVQITMKGVTQSSSLKSLIDEKVSKLSRFYNRIMSCRVVLELSKNHMHQGKLFNVRVDLTIPGKELAITKKSDPDLYIAIRDAFEAMSRKLEDHVRRKQGKVKTHESTMHGIVTRLLSDEGYGFIKGIDGNEYYFSELNVSHPSFDQLNIGDDVLYIAHSVSDGRQAHHVVKSHRE